jgi:hypothetical protein
MRTFKATSQYGDWKGTAAADNSDPVRKSVHDYLEQHRLLKGEEFLLAVEFGTADNAPEDLKSPYIRAYMLQGARTVEQVEKLVGESKATGRPIPVREIEIEVSALDFVGMFKRFSVVLTWHGLGQEMDYSVNAPRF